ncbi:response regulator transcription factor [Labilibacter sediminis]|nr:response regulator transcription factor [Labilibacter sediminis]
MYKILVVDDHVESLQVIINFIKNAHPDYTIYQAITAKLAIKIADMKLPDLIITDWDMPSMSGVELVKYIKSQDKTKDIPVIMATGVMLTSANLQIALEAGSIDYIRKPIDPIELEARMHSAIKLIEEHKSRIEFENSKLTESALYLARNNEFMVDVKKKLANFASFVKLKDVEQDMLNLIIDEFDEKVKSDSWERFELAFKSAHPNFNKYITSAFPDLTPSEIRLANFIRMGMSIKNIASVLYQSPDSIKVARSRLRKKLDIDTSRNLETFLSKY